MEQTYDPIYFDTLGESFTSRHRAERNEYLEDFPPPPLLPHRTRLLRL